jgi:hypothetical protein
MKLHLIEVLSAPASLASVALRPASTGKVGLFGFLVLLTICALACPSTATVVPVKHKEGVSHGFIVLRSQQGEQLATGDMIQNVEGGRVVSEVVLRFKDGSIHDEVTVFSQERAFRLISDHLKQYGPSFPNAVDVFIDAKSGNVKVHSEKDGKTKDDVHHLDIPEDVATGLTETLLKNISPSAQETDVPMVTTSDKPRLVKLKIHAEGKRSFWTGGYARKAVHYVVHVDIGGIAGAVAPIVGKQPPDSHIWVLGGRAPSFVKFEGPLYEGGPIWDIDLMAPHWGSDKRPDPKKKSASIAGLEAVETITPLGFFFDVQTRSVHARSH